MENYEKILNEAKQNLNNAKGIYFTKKGKAEQLEHQKTELQKNLQKAVDNIEILEQVRLLLQKTSDFAREQSKQRIESFVTNCLQYIFDSDMYFKIEMSESRGRAEAEFFVVSNFNGEELKTKPEEARGGGVVDIVSLAIRIAMLQCSTLEIDGPIILDEPAKHVSDEYIIQVAEFLKQASNTFGRQIIMITHNKHLSEIADKAFKVEFDGEKSVIS